MKKLRIIGLIFLLIIGLIILSFVTGVVSVPTIKNYSSRWGEITDNTTEIITSIQIDNSNPFNFNVPIAKVEYTMEMNNIEMAHGIYDDINLKKGLSTVELVSYFDNRKIPEWWVSHLKNNELTTVDIKPEIVIDLVLADPGVKVSSKTIPIETNILANVDNLDGETVQVGLIDLDFNPSSVSWGTISNQTTEILLDVVITNPVNFSIQMPEVNYAINMNNITIGEGSIKNSVILEPEEDTTINMVTKIENDMLDNWFVSHLRNNEHSTIEIFMNTTVRYKNIDYEIDDFNIYTHDFDTNILGVKL